MLYTDPGSGAMIWQLLLAFFFGISFFFNRIKSWIVTSWDNRKNSRPMNVHKSNHSTDSISSKTEGL